jgi:mRNA interferase RelE/StbE
MWLKNMGLNYKVGFSDDARKSLKKLTGVDLKRILRKTLELEKFKELNNIKALKGELSGFYRLRVGKMRVIFEVDEENRVIKVVDAGFRGSIYK